MKKLDSKKLWLEVHADIPDDRVMLGKASSNAYRQDPKMIGFMAARYKFVAKMLEGCSSALEIGCGDGFGAPLVAQAVGKLICTDIDELTIKDNSKRLSFVNNLNFEYYDFREQNFHTQVEAAYCVDVIEHIFPSEERLFIENIVSSIARSGIAIFGTPNKTAEQYASENSRKGHINLKDHNTLRELLLGYFHRVFIFSMNDEVLHTGYYPMAHYLWALCVDPKHHTSS